MFKEFSYGAVIYKTEDEKILFLLVRSRRSGSWGFPKGHCEKGESPIETAKREIYEETGINEVKFDADFQKRDVYPIDGSLTENKGKRTQKHSVYFLALALTDAKKEPDEEIQDLQWFDFGAALEKLSFESQKETLKEANVKLGGKNGKSVIKK
ncbi:MAG: NUDIX domain-containing protein [Endomicrobium sp.]|nr:NUDIX domain-containing protein [Endomicrobium sp.]